MAATLARLAAALGDAREPWWIIGSTALALHGAAVTPADVDVLLGEADARRLAERFGLALAAGAPDPRFRSRAFARWPLPVPVELMAGFERRADPGEWAAVSPRTRIALPVGRAIVYLPDAAEMRALLVGFGRPKDLARVALLDEALSRPAAPAPRRRPPRAIPPR